MPDHPLAAPDRRTAARSRRPPATPHRRTAASTPGKLILAGEHAVVYGRPALIAAVDLRLAANFEAATGDREDAAAVRVVVPPLGLVAAFDWSQILDYAGEARRRWQTYAAAPTAAGFAAVRGDDPAHLVKVALGEAAAHLGEEGGPSLTLTVDAELPVGAGFGSSAAAAVAMVAGYLALRGVRPTAADVERLALEVERRQHGMPSGVDGATVLHGGIRWAERDAEGRLATAPLATRSPLLARLRVFDTGAPAEATGAVVAAVRDRLATDRRRFEAVLDRIAEATRALRDQLGLIAEDPAKARELIIACHRALVELGVVPAAVRELIERVEAEGGAAKISGAGSLAGPGAGSLLVYHPDLERVEGWSFLRPYRHYPVALGAAGLRLETVAASAEGPA